MRMVISIKRFATLFRSSAVWIAFYLLLGSLFFYVGSLTEQYRVVSTSLSSIGGALFAIGLVTILVEVNTSWHVLQILHMYGDYKTHGIYRVFPNSKSVEYQELYARVTEKPRVIRIISLVGRKYADNDDKIKATYEMAQSAAEARLALVEIGNHGYRYRYEYLEPTGDADVVGTSNATILRQNQVKLQQLISSLSQDKKELRFYKALPIFNLELFDDYLFVSFYGYRSRAKDRSPIFVFQKRQSEVFRYFMDQFEQYWNDV